MDEIPIVKELGDRFESSIQKSMLRNRRSGPSIAVAAFAVTILVFGVTAAFVSQQSPDPGAAAPRGVEEPVASSDRWETVLVSDIAALLPTPDGMSRVDGPQAEAIDGLPVAGVATLKFVNAKDGNTVSITANIIVVGKNPTKTDDDVGERVAIGDAEATLVTSGSLLSVSWEPVKGLKVQIVSRGAVTREVVTREYVLQYANDVDGVVATVRDGGDDNG
jgi:hypothetical protein